MEAPDRIEGVLCEECNKEHDHTFVSGHTTKDAYDKVTFNGIQCAHCGHKTIAWAETKRVREMFDRWEADRSNSVLEAEFRQESVQLILWMQEEVNK